jgi:hypothetical protein
MSSDNIKNALTTAYPNSSEKDWKRRTKKKLSDCTERAFEHTEYGTVLTYELPDGSVTIGQQPVAVINSTPVIDTVPFHDPVLANEITITANSILNTMVQKVSEITGSNAVNLPTDGIVSDIVEGDRILIPTGTQVWKYDDYYDNINHEVKICAEEEQTVLYIKTIGNYLSMANTDTLIAIYEAMEALAPRRNRPCSENRSTVLGNVAVMVKWMEEKNPQHLPAIYQSSSELQALMEKAKAEAIANEGHAPKFVIWGGVHNRKAARLSDVIKIQDKADVRFKAASKKKEKTLTKRNLMVEGSKWRFAQDVDITMWVRNPKIDQLCHQRNSISRSGNSHVGNTIILGGGVPNTPAEKQTIASIQEEINNCPRVVQQNMGIIQAGTEFTVVGKLAAGYKWGQKETNGLLVPVKVTKGSVGNIPITGYDGGLPYNQIEKFVEAISIPETIVYVLRDRETGDYFGGWETDKKGYQTSNPKMSSTFSGSKKYKTSSAVKASIRDFTGYNSGLDSEGSEEWVGIGYDSKKIDLPSTWELVGIDKTTLTDKSIEDIKSWYTELWRLRNLTKTVGSAVRSVYKKAEGKGFDAIVLFKVMDDYGTFEECENLPSFIDSSMKNITTKYIRTKTETGIAFACSMEDAVLAQLSVSHPELEVTAYRFGTLEEIVKEKS